MNNEGSVATLDEKTSNLSESEEHKPESQLSDLFDFLQRQLGPLLKAGLKAYENEPLVEMSWLQDNVPGNFKINMSLADGDLQIASFKVFTGDNEQLELGMRWSLTHMRGKQLAITFNASEWNAVVPIINYDEMSQNLSSPQETWQTRNLAGLPDATEFGNLWFGEAGNGVLVHSVQRQNRGPVLCPKLRPIGPLFQVPPSKGVGKGADKKGGKRWGFIHPAITVVSSDGEFSIPEDRQTALGEHLAGLLVGNFVWRIMLNAFAGRFEGLNFPTSEHYELRRPVDLETDKVMSHLEANGLHFPRHVVDAACISLNAGKNVIFTGPPGCGKTKLAVILSELAKGTAPVLATASPAWTNDELIGRYLPNLNGKGLVFQPGFFLKAIEDDKWLLIDEMNRADLDRSFGELFSVLAGDTAELAFNTVEDEAELTEGVMKRIRVIPARRATSTKAHLELFRNYYVPTDFRVLGTMNDADRASLHHFSFALQRRFNLIRVEAPPPNIVRKIVENLTKEHLFESMSYRLEKESGGRTRAIRVNAEARLTEDILSLCTPAADQTASFRDLVSERVIGIAALSDIVRFVAEGLRAPSSEERQRLAISEDDVPTNAGNDLIRSLMAMAVVLCVYPQLDALLDDTAKLSAAVKHIMTPFKGFKFRRIEDGRLAEDGTINEYLRRELDLHLNQYGPQFLQEMWMKFESEGLLERW